MIDSAWIVLVVTVPSMFAAVVGLVLAVARRRWGFGILGLGLGGLFLSRFYGDLAMGSVVVMLAGGAVLAWESRRR